MTIRAIALLLSVCAVSASMAWAGIAEKQVAARHDDGSTGEIIASEDGVFQLDTESIDGKSPRLQLPADVAFSAQGWGADDVTTRVSVVCEGETLVSSVREGSFSWVPKKSGPHRFRHIRRSDDPYEEPLIETAVVVVGGLEEDSEADGAFAVPESADDGTEILTATSACFQLDTESIDGKTPRHDFPAEIAFSSRDWDTNALFGVARVVCEGETIWTATDDGAFFWRPKKTGLHHFKLIRQEIDGEPLWDEDPVVDETALVMVGDPEPVVPGGDVLPGGEVLPDPADGHADGETLASGAGCVFQLDTESIDGKTPRYAFPADVAFSSQFWETNELCGVVKVVCEGETLWTSSDTGDFAWMPKKTGLHRFQLLRTEIDGEPIHEEDRVVAAATVMVGDPEDLIPGGNGSSGGGGGSDPADGLADGAELTSAGEAIFQLDTESIDGKTPRVLMPMAIAHSARNWEENRLFTTATVACNGEVVVSSSGEQALDWVAPASGRYRFVHTCRDASYGDEDSVQAAEIVVTGPSVHAVTNRLAQQLRLTSDPSDAAIYYTLGGAFPTVESVRYARPLDLGAFEGPTVLRAMACLPGGVAGPVLDLVIGNDPNVDPPGDEIAQWVKPTVSGGAASWDYDTTVGNDVVRSGAIGDDEESWLEVVVTNAGKATFSWKVSSETFKQYKVDYLSFSVDGVEQDWIGGEVDWERRSYEIAGEGEHRLRWVYVKDENDSDGLDCGWVKDFVWQPLVAVSYDANGAVGALPKAVSGYAGETVVVASADSLEKPFSGFAGWCDGEARVWPNETFVLREVDVVLTAMWNPRYAECPEIDVDEAFWNDETWVSITCGQEGAEIRYTLDGSDPETGFVYEGPFLVRESVVIRARAFAADSYPSEVVEAETVRMPYTVAECLNDAARVFEDDTASVWLRDREITHDGVAAVRSGAVADNGVSTLRTRVLGSGTVSFWWKVSSETFKSYKVDYLSFAVDGEEKAWIGGERDWAQVVVDVEGSGEHVLTWNYSKDDADANGADCGWLDQFVWEPLCTDVPVKGQDFAIPRDWFDCCPDLVAAHGGDLEQTILSVSPGASGHGKKHPDGTPVCLWEDYLAGTDPRSDKLFTVKIEMRDGQPVITWDPDLNVQGTKQERVYRTLGVWNLGDPWREVVPGTEGDSRFFKVEVALP